MNSQAIQCCISVRGRVAPHWSRWLAELQPTYRVSRDGDDVTDLTGTLADQCALRGVLDRIWNLNLTVLLVVTSPAEMKRGGPGGKFGSVRCL